MRFLNKIIFINSASVKFDEIELDGNIHLTGNQGVGKSTLLRAILFFYNADKSKLGIPREKKRFDEYYYEWQNSYIIYEVMKDENPYCVLTFKQNGRVAYRFFDSAYKKEFFMDKEGRVFHSWDEIRNALGKDVHYSKIISTYDEFRKIIYGDNQGMKPEFRKYAILESKQFQNIPRTIQNVLLNSKLEAQFIKDTIIKSLDEEEIKIDLANYSKNHLRDFETELNNINIWFKKNRNGLVTVRKQAESVTDNYRVFNFLKQEKTELVRRLAQRLNFVSEQKPVVVTTLAKEENILIAFEKKLSNIKNLHLKREQKIISEIRLLKSKIDDADRKTKFYEGRNIFTKIEKLSEKESLLNQQKSLEEEKNLLTSKFSDISHKYQHLLSQIENQFVTFRNLKEAKKNELRSDFNKQKNEIFNEFDNRIEQLREDYQTQENFARNDVEDFKEQESQVKQKKAGLKNKVFYKTEIEKLEATKQNSEKLLNNFESKIAIAKNNISILKQEFELEEKHINFNFENSFEKLSGKKSELKSKIEKIEQKIELSKSSFYGWLNENLPNWEKTIGKVVEQENVLFSNELNPEKTEGTNSNFFGVKINLEALESNVKTVSEFRQEIENFRIERENISKNINKLFEQKRIDLKKSKMKFSKKINILNEGIFKNEYDFDKTKNQLKQTQNQLYEIEQKAKKDKKEKMQNLESQIVEITFGKGKAEVALKKIENDFKRTANKMKKERSSEIESRQSELKNILSKINSELEFKKGEISQKKAQIRREQNYELANEGADTNRLESIENELESTQKELDFIFQNEPLVIEYQKDKRELFDKVPELKNEKKSLEKQKDSFQEKHKLEKEKVIEKTKTQSQKVESLKEQIAIFEADFDEFEKFKISDVFQNVEEVFSKTESSSSELEKASSIISQINEKHFNSITRLNDLENSIARFSGNFNEDNVFKFKTKFENDEDYLNFAVELKEFIEEDKISQFEKRVNERFASIIRLIGKETNDLVSKEAEIEKIISKINKDFLAKNFVGAIKSMQMRTQESTNKIVKLLLRIRKFNEEFSLSLGTANLFSNETHDADNQKAIDLLRQLVKELNAYKSDVLTLSESFDLQFKIVENDNDSGWVENLSNVGSEGTDVLVKAMINILLLNVFKESASKKFKDFKLHCMMDEVGRLHPNNVKGILRFANDRNILLINCSPMSFQAMDYRYTYSLSKKQTQDNKHITKITKVLYIKAKQ